MSYRKLMKDLDEAAKKEQIVVPFEDTIAPDFVIEYDDEGNEYIFLRKVTNEHV